MKKNKITKSLVVLITYIIEYAIAFSVADGVTNFYGINHIKILSSGFAVYVVIATIIILTLEILFSKIKDKCSKRKISNQ